MPLTDSALRNAKPQEKQYKLTDGGGMFLLVMPNGSRFWRLAYRFDGKQKLLALGAYPLISLVEARKKRDDAKRLLTEGKDPGEARKADRRQQKLESASTFKAIAEEWFNNQDGRWAQSYSTRIWSRIEDDLLPELGDRVAGEILPLEMLDVLRKIEARGAIESAKRIKNYASQILQYALITGRVERDVTSDIGRALKPISKSSVKRRASLKAEDLPEFMRKLEAYDGEEETRLALHTIVLTFVRTNEVRFAVKGEFEDLDGKEPLWRIPAERMKMNLPHLVPLAPQVVPIIQRLIDMNSKSDLLFPAMDGNRMGNKAMSENTMIYAMYRMGYKSRATVHGFRSTASTILNESGFASDWIERQLAHVEANEVRAAYNAAQWLPDRRKMMNGWADYIDQQARSGKVIRHLRVA
jgi:integrase